MSDSLLPEEFADLEPFAARWCIPGEPARYTARLNSTMADMQAFYDAAFPRVRDAMAYLDQFRLDELPERAENLLHLVYSFVMVSLPVEVWHQPRVIDAGTAYFDRYLEPAP
ncbi:MULTISPECIES: hypothetical protein [unclassified Pseudofrankia]|uniref:hypothetical protein n=1 Tax=unclassified Pseudofrankia TaxID=2994372 RepID=UPI0008DA671C|nr:MULTISPECIES: hypothetical protein [unclassified Pseudofrankia]MDT3439378.1 hypothetical protein [Pseudofrankia sp. BMG5.37]OHV65038.1 hypothetical protein BCD48_36795 [Pseudofrankia sp. BMG5.36]